MGRPDCQEEITPESMELIQAYSFYQSGFLPNGKGWLNESAKFLKAMQIINNFVNKVQEEKRGS